jgi:hypothetical protein
MITKTEAQVRQFFTNARRRLSLDAIVKEHEAERQKQQQLMNDDKTPSNSSQDPSTSSFLNPQFVIDAKAKKRATENIIMEVIIDFSVFLCLSYFMYFVFVLLTIIFVGYRLNLNF